MYAPWCAVAHDYVEIVPIELPGHGRRLAELPCQDMPGVVRLLCHELAAIWSPDVALFGHSMGALIAFELAAAMRALGRGEPLAIFVSAADAPHCPRRRPPCHDKDDEELKRKLVELNGTPREVIEDPDLCRMVLPIVRADFRIVETYRWTPQEPLSCPIVAFAGSDDAAAPPDTVAEWRRHTTAEATLHVVPGDHFFVHDQFRPMLETICRALARARLAAA